MAREGSLAGEMHQRRGFASPAQEAFVNLMVTQDRLLRQVARLLRPHGLSPAQLNVLRILRGAAEEGLPCQEIAARLIHRLPDVTRLIDRLERARLATRGRDEKDRRVVRVRIAPAGLDLLAGLDEPLAALHERQFRALRKAELAELNRLLDRVRPSERS